MARKAKVVDPTTRPPLKIGGNFTADTFLMYLIQDVTKLPTSDILGFFADLAKIMADEGVHFMYENGTSSMRKEVFDYFPGTAIPFSLKLEGNKRPQAHYDKEARQWVHETVAEGTRVGTYYVTVGFPSEKENVDQTELANIIMEKAILGGCDMPPFERPDTKCPKMYKDLMKEVQSRRMV